MNYFEKNYFSLYLNFLIDFKGLTYRGFSIPYFCVFPRMVLNTKNQWSNILFNKELIQQLPYSVKNTKELQAEFNRYIQAKTKKTLSRKKDGKVLLNVDGALRFPLETFKNYFDSSNTIIIDCFENRSKNKGETSTRKRKVRVNMLNTIKIQSNKKGDNPKNLNIKQQVPKLIDKIGINHIPVDYLLEYSTNTERAVTQIENKAKAIIESYNYHPLYGEKQFQRVFLSQISRIINWIDAAKNYLDKVSVSCIVLSHPHFNNRILAWTAAERGIPTICMQHGLIGSGYLPKIATIDAVYGNFEKDWYTKVAGLPKESIEIIGHPKFDKLLSRLPMSKSLFQKRLGIDSRNKTLLVVIREDYDMKEWRILIKSISENYRLNILIRDYPGRETNTLSKEFPFVHSTKNLHLYDILPNVDAVVTYPSTVALEAMLANRPAFILEKNFLSGSNHDYGREYLSNDRSLIWNPFNPGYFNILEKMVQDDPRKLSEAIISYFKSPSWQNYALKKRKEFLNYVYPDVTNSGERLKNLINRLTT